GAATEQDTRAMFYDALCTALQASDTVQSALTPPAPERLLAQVRERLDTSVIRTPDADDLVQLAEVVRGMAARHGPAVLRHCRRILEDVDALLRDVTGSAEGAP